MNKRFQECNWLVKLWRLRYYVVIPFQWIYYSWFKNFTVIDIETNNPEEPLSCETLNLRGRELWGVLLGSAQGKMKWYWEMDEVLGKLNFGEDEVR
jgi:hypothetical protein